MAAGNDQDESSVAIRTAIRIIKDSLFSNLDAIRQQIPIIYSGNTEVSDEEKSRSLLNVIDITLRVPAARALGVLEKAITRQKNSQERKG